MPATPTEAAAPRPAKPTVKVPTSKPPAKAKAPEVPPSIELALSLAQSEEVWSAPAPYHDGITFCTGKVDFSRNMAMKLQWSVEGVHASTIVDVVYGDAGHAETAPTTRHGIDKYLLEAVHLGPSSGEGNASPASPSLSSKASDDEAALFEATQGLPSPHASEQRWYMRYKQPMFAVSSRDFVVRTTPPCRLAPEVLGAPAGAEVWATATIPCGAPHPPAKSHVRGIIHRHAVFVVQRPVAKGHPPACDITVVLAHDMCGWLPKAIVDASKGETVEQLRNMVRLAREREAEKEGPTRPALHSPATVPLPATRSSKTTA